MTIPTSGRRIGRIAAQSRISRISPHQTKPYPATRLLLLRLLLLLLLLPVPSASHTHKHKDKSDPPFRASSREPRVSRPPRRTSLLVPPSAEAVATTPSCRKRCCCWYSRADGRDPAAYLAIEAAEACLGMDERRSEELPHQTRPYPEDTIITARARVPIICLRTYYFVYFYTSRNFKVSWG